MDDYNASRKRASENTIEAIQPPAKRFKSIQPSAKYSTINNAMDCIEQSRKRASENTIEAIQPPAKRFKSIQPSAMKFKSV